MKYRLWGKHINQKILDQNFWKNKSEAEKVVKLKKLYEDLINSHNSSIKESNDLFELHQYLADASEAH